MSSNWNARGRAGPYFRGQGNFNRGGGRGGSGNTTAKKTESLGQDTWCYSVLKNLDGRYFDLLLNEAQMIGKTCKVPICSKVPAFHLPADLVWHAMMHHPGPAPAGGLLCLCCEGRTVWQDEPALNRHLILNEQARQRYARPDVLDKCFPISAIRALKSAEERQQYTVSNDAHLKVLLAEFIDERFVEALASLGVTRWHLKVCPVFPSTDGSLFQRWLGPLIEAIYLRLQQEEQPTVKKTLVLSLQQIMDEVQTYAFTPVVDVPASPETVTSAAEDPVDRGEIVHKNWNALYPELRAGK